jgi:hypothetical protein
MEIDLDPIAFLTRARDHAHAHTRIAKLNRTLSAFHAHARS